MPVKLINPEEVVQAKRFAVRLPKPPPPPKKPFPTKYVLLSLIGLTLGLMLGVAVAVKLKR